MKKIILCVLAACFTIGARSQENPKITVGPNETTELMSVVMYLSEAREYSREGIWSEYRELVDSVFAPYKKHPAIEKALHLRDEFTLFFDKPMNIAVSGAIENGEFRAPYTTYYEWGKNTHDDFLAAISDFYRETNFHDFYTKTSMPMYKPVQEVLEKGLRAIVDTDWFTRFTGIEKDNDFFITISYLNGPYNYGLERGGVPRPIIGLWYRESILAGDMNTIAITALLCLHEFMHPYINPLIDRYYSALAPSGQVLFPPIRERMEKAAYPLWLYVQYEALVRTSVIAYMREKGWNDDEEIASQKSRDFWWLGELADKLKEYETQRDKYPTLESFMPEIVKFYNDLAAREKNS